MNTKTSLSLVIATALGGASGLFAQPSGLQFPASSPACTLKQRVGLTDVEIVYSRPSARGRPVLGGLVPYGEVWRTGANNATRLTFSTPVKLNGHDVPAGTNALFTIPGDKEWTIILNKTANQFGAFQYDEKLDLLRFKVTPAELGEKIETFTIELGDIRDDSATIYLCWEKTVVPIKLKVDLNLTPERIEAVMSGEGRNKPYYQAALFYYENGLDLKKASEWIDAALAQREAHYMLYWKAKIRAGLGDKQAALAASKRSTELAIKANDKGYVRLNEDLQATLQ